MRRGFKSQAEKNAEAARKALHLDSIAPLDPWKYAEHLGVVVLDLEKLDLTPAAVKQLIVSDVESWSAMTIKEGDTLGIVLNPAHALTRQRNDLMHELAHIELRHAPARVDVSKSGWMLLSDYSEDQEQEADWHGAALLLPRSGLVSHRARNKSVPDIANIYGVSNSLCEWRLRMTGVDVQMRRMR